MRLKPRSTKRHMFTCTQCMQCVDACEKVQIIKYPQPLQNNTNNDQNYKGVSLLKMLENNCALDSSTRDFGNRPEIPPNCYSTENKGKRCC